MKILAIRLKNLASLPGPVEIDFMAAPLARAGLYAIVGPTGAGKSTLLDALCLALFGKTPRLRGVPGRTTTTPDGDNDPIATADARTLLRRGCSGGHAEVDFVGQDQRRYRSRWEVRRARGRAGGRLQPVERSLVDLDADSFLTTQTQEHDGLIEQRLGLSFDQFTRAVLLAQAEFGAFLKAGDKERAELLEKLTDTARFSRISKAAYARKRSADAEVDRLQRESGGSAPLAEAERLELDAELAAAQGKLSGWSKRQRALAELLAWWDQQGSLERILQGLAEDLGAQERAQGTLTGERLLLQQLDTVAPLRDTWRESTRLVRALVEQARLASELEQQLQAAEAQRLLAERGRDEAFATRTQARAAIQAELPTLRQAQVLETEINLGRVEAERRSERLRQVRSELERAASAHTAAAAALQLAQQAGLATSQELATLAAWNELHAGWSAHRLSLQEVVAILAQLQALEREEPTLVTGAATAATALRQSLYDSESATAAIAAADAELAATADAAPELALLHERLLEQQGAQAALAHEIGELRDFSALQARRHRLVERSDELLAQATATAEMITAAQLAFEQAEREHVQTQALLDRLRLARSAEVAELRAQLVAGDPCPVCGSPEHPYAHAHAVESLYARSDEHELARARGHAEQARERWQRLEQQRADVAARIAESMAARTQVERELALRLARITDATVALEIGELGADVVLVRLQGRQSEHEQALANTRAQRELLQQRQQLRQGVVDQRDTARARREDAEQRRHQAQREQDAAALVLERHRGRQQQARTHLESRRGALSHLLPGAHWSRLESAPAAVFSEIDGVLEHLDALVRRQRQQAVSELERIQALERLSAAHRVLKAEHTRVATEHCGLEHQLGELRNRLRELLGVHLDAQRWSEAQEQARERAELALVAADEALQSMRQRRAAVVERMSTRERDQAALAAALAPLQSQIDEFLAARDGFDRDLLEQLCMRPPEQAGQLRQRIDADDAQLFAVRLRMAERTEELAAHGRTRTQLWQRFHDTLDAPPALSELERPLWAGLVPRPELSASERDEVESAHAMSRRNCADASAELDELRLRQREDGQRRLQRAHVQRELEHSLREQQRWGQISELIGSADGAAFRQIAQAYNLDILLAHANGHLSELAPRYRLRRSGNDLGLLVSDRDMGEALRSVHSLSGGESFLVSLALALGLAAMSSRRLRIESLFIDEGFGVLDPQALDLALEALDGLQSLGRKVGVISHVAEMLERIPVQIRVLRSGHGASSVEVVDTHACV